MSAPFPASSQSPSCCFCAFDNCVRMATSWPPPPSEQALPLEAVMTAPQPSGRLATPKGVAPGAAWPARPAWIAGRQAVSKFENQYLLPHVCGFSGI